jgi:hypothetical protein
MILTKNVLAAQAMTLANNGVKGISERYMMLWRSFEERGTESTSSGYPLTVSSKSGR